MKVTIYWRKAAKTDIQKEIREKFNIPNYLTINGETPCEISDSDFESLKKIESQGFIQLRIK